MLQENFEAWSGGNPAVHFNSESHLPVVGVALWIKEGETYSLVRRTDWVEDRKRNLTFERYEDGKWSGEAVVGKFPWTYY